MTDFELASLYNEVGMNITSNITAYVSILFAFLVGSYLAARQMSRSMATVAIGLFSLYSLVSIGRTMGNSETLVGLAGRLHEAAQAEGADLAWHGAAVSTPESLAWGWWIYLIIFLIAYAGAIYFFFACRRGAFRFTG